MLPIDESSQDERVPGKGVKRAAAIAAGLGVMWLAMTLVAQGASASKAQPQGQIAGPEQPKSSCSFVAVNTPNTGPTNDFRGTVALAPDNVWAVGVYYTPDNISQTLIEHWDGTAWSVVPSPSPSNQVNELNGVAAISAGDVWAVGDSMPNGSAFAETLIEHWDGTTWLVVPSVHLGISGSFLYGVTVIAANDVWAVGYYPVASVDATLTEHWDGTAWTYIPGPTPAFGGRLQAVSGLSANDVWAVGFFIDIGFIEKTLAEYWDGNAWLVVASPNPQSFRNTLRAVSALSADDVWAVGDSVDINSISRTLVEHWDGNAWRGVPSPNRQSNLNELLGVSARSANDVWAAGEYDSDNGGHARTLLEHWDGTQWSIIPSPNPDTDTNVFESISGVGTSDVWAVGSYDHPNGGLLTLAEHWDGTQWTTVTTPSPGAANNGLAGVAAVSANDVWAVGTGTRVSDNSFRTLIEHWDGTQWSIVPSPTLTATSSSLGGVDSIATNDVWAVGSYRDQTTGNYETLTENWNGTAWSAVPSPNVGTSSYLDGVSARTSSDVWAVGAYLSGTSHRTLIEHWDGTQWSKVTSADTGDNDSLATVAAISANDLWAMGYFLVNNVSHPLVEHWDGSAWSLVMVPDPTGGYLESVSADAANDVWAVGYYTEGSVQHALVEHWDGATWSTMPSPDPGTRTNELSGVVAISSHEVWTVGLYGAGTPPQVQTLVEHWDGTQWSIVPSEKPGTGGSALLSVSPVGQNDIWAVGYDNNGPSLQTLTEHYTCAPPTPTPSPTPIACSIQFEDVRPGSTFYPFVRCMACRGIINGYSCGGAGQPCDPNRDPYFRPGANVTRGQIAKIVALSSGNHSPVSGQSFHDVPPGSTFYTYTEQLAALGVMSGYPCGGAGEPCEPGNLPYFRPNSSATRGQLSKIVANAAGYHNPPSGRQFQDVPPGSTFYTYTYELVSRSIMAGYPCGGAGEPCGPGSSPYFRPNNQVTRGQTAKIVGNTFFPDCQSP